MILGKPEPKFSHQLKPPASIVLDAGSSVIDRRMFQFTLPRARLILESNLVLNELEVLAEALREMGSTRLSRRRRASRL
jgi:hypothetical protein